MLRNTSQFTLLKLRAGSSSHLIKKKKKSQKINKKEKRKKQKKRKEKNKGKKMKCNSKKAHSREYFVHTVIPMSRIK